MTPPRVLDAQPMPDGRRRTAFILVIILCSFSPIEADESRHARRDIYCGPRCVQRVLEYYEKDEDLVELVRQIQWPVKSTGATLEQLQQAIQSRGIETRAVQIPKNADFHWNQPAIFHLLINGVAHYVVWLPPRSQDANPSIWGASFNHRVTPDEFLKSQTGVVLLTSESPIPENPTLSLGRMDASTMPWLFTSAIGAFVAAAYWTKSNK